jgi:hypothetical protein
MKKTSVALLILFSTIAVSCRKDAINNLDNNEGIVYITDHDSSVNFSNYVSFRIADSVSVIEDGRLITRDYGTYDSSLIAAVTQAMAQRGFQLQPDKTVTPDVGINITKLISSHTGVVSYYDYWDDYGGYWDPYDWGYGGYDYYMPYAIGTYTFREGALSVDMLDLKNPDRTNNQLRNIWTGVARGTGIFNSANISEVVQNLFNQSTYLHH